MAYMYAERSSCNRAAVGVIAVKDWRPVAAGYVGSPRGMPHCTDVGVGCEIGTDGGCIRTVHAEANMIAWAAREGVPLLGTIVFSTHAPCLACAKLIINAGVDQFVFDATYRDPQGLALLAANLNWTGDFRRAKLRWH
jgi:dCMP deaminase